MPFEPIRTDVDFVVNTGQFRANMGLIRESYAATTGAMSDDAIKLALSQERLQRSIERTGTASAATMRAALAYRQTVAALQPPPVQKLTLAEQLQKVQPAARVAGRALTTYVTAPVLLLGYEATKMAISFQDAMELIHTQAAASQAEVAKLSGDILNLAKSGKSFGQSAKDMADGLFYVESEGIRGARALEIVRVASAGAALGQTSLANTTDALTSAMKVYDVTAGHAAETMATINAAVGAGKMHLEDLNAALGTKFLPTAKQLGITLPQALAALDVFTRAGVPAENAATNLTTAFIKFEAPTKASTKALAAMGLGSRELADQLNSGGLPSALGLLAQRYDAVVKAQGKVAANRDIINAFGGIKGGSSVLTLVQQYSSYVQGLEQVQQHANPASFWKDVAAEMNLPSQKIKKDVAAITAQMIEVGQKLAPIAASLAGDIAMIARGFAKLPGPVRHDLGAIIAVLAVGGPLLVAIAGVIRAITTIGAAFKTVPAAAGPAIATTDAELATMGATATTTAGEVAGIGGAATTATGEVSALRGGLIGLAALGTVVVTVQVLEEFIPKGFEKKGQKILKQGGGGWLGSIPIIGPVAAAGAAAGRDARNAVTGGHSQQPTVIPTQYRGHPDEEEAYLSGRQNQAFPFPFSDPNFGPDYRAYLAGRKDGGNPVGGPKDRAKPAPSKPASPPGPKPPPTYKPSRAAELNLALAKNPNDIAAIRAKLAYDEQAIAFANKELASGKLSRKRGKEVMQELQQLYGDEQSLQGQLHAIAQQAAEKNRKRAEAAKKAREKVLAARKKHLQSLTQVPVQLRLEEATARAHSASAKRLLKILEEEKQALERQIVLLKKIGASKQYILEARQREAAVEGKITALEKKKKASKTAAELEKENERQFLAAFAQTVSAYAPNAFPNGKANTRLYELVNETRITNQHLRTISGRSRFPGSIAGIDAAQAVTG